ncbi:MAG: NYN domain-containing protein [Bacteroidia bacterium]
MEKKQVAIYLDFENIAISAGEVYKHQFLPVKMEPIVSFAEAKGRLRVKKVYADWSKKKFAQYQKNLMVQGFELIHLPETNLLGKNGSDMRLVVDVMDHIQTYPEIDTVIIGSGDSDFIPLLQFLLSKNIEVIIIGFDHSVSDVIKHYCSEFRSLEEIIGPPEKPKGPSPRQLSRVRGLLQKVIREQGPGPFSFSFVEKALAEISPRFAPEAYGYSSFKKMIRSFEGDIVDSWEKKGNKKFEVTFLEKRGRFRKSGPTESSDEKAKKDLARKKKAPGFKKAKDSLRAWIDEVEVVSPLPLSRIKSGLLRKDEKFSEKKLGFSSFKAFAMAMVGEVFDKIELNESTLLVHFSKTENQKEATAPETSSKNPAAADNGNGIDKVPATANGTHAKTAELVKEKETKTPKPKSNGKPASKPASKREQRPARTEPAEKSAQSAEDIGAAAKSTLYDSLLFIPDPIFRQDLASTLLDAFSKKDVYKMGELRTMIQKRGEDISEAQAAKYLLTLKFGGALMSDNRHASFADKQMKLKAGILQSESLDFLYIEQISDVLKRKHKGISNSQILDLLFS